MSFGIVKELVGPVTGLLSEFIEDKDQKARLAHEIATLAQKEAHKNAALQLEVNKIEAAHASIFVSGWRPALGWFVRWACLGTLSQSHSLTLY